MSDTKETPQSTVTVSKVKKSNETKLVQKQSSFAANGINLGRPLREGLDPKLLLNLVITNNTLPLCIEAMEVNVDGTGHDIVAVSDDIKESEAERKIAESFFKEPYPNTSMIKLRREVRRFMEATGNGYLELMYSLAGELQMIRSLNPQYVKMGRLSSPVEVSRTIERNGQLIEIKMQDRERSYVYQAEGEEPTYMIEFGSTQDIDAKTGRFSLEKGSDGATVTPVAAVDRGSKIIHLKMNDDPNSDYGIPRWISQTPSVVGSRKAEEQNLEFFDAGGIPNVIVFVKGGAVASSTTDQLNGFLSGNVKTGGRAAVVEVASTSGTIDKAGSVEVQVERFGSEAMGDKMYEDYDNRCEERVRLAFRLPALFIGKTSDYNYSTARVAYQVAEAQVFKPDRDEFDAIMNQIILKELKLKTVAFKSRPITLNDVDAQLKALEITKEVIDPKEMVAEVSRISNTTLKYVEGKTFTVFTDANGRKTTTQQVDPNAPQPTSPTTTSEPKKPKDTEVSNNSVSNDKKKLTAKQAQEVAKGLAQYSGLLNDDTDIDDEQAKALKELFASLDSEDQGVISDTISMMIFGATGMVSKEQFYANS